MIRISPRRVLWVTLVLAAFTLVGAIVRSRTPREGASQRQPTVVLIVLDAVRRDRIEPLGYERPTTPMLAELAASGTTYPRMVVPGSWTLPVHASIFTGHLPTVHGADFDLDGHALAGLGDLRMAPLQPRIPTLAEDFRRAGYQTVLVSGNPVLHPTLGLTRGFEVADVASGFRSARHALVFSRVENAVRTLDPMRPLFLAVNVVIAHGPFEGIPRGISWVPPTPTIGLFEQPLTESRFSRFMRGVMPEPERTRLLDELADVYDWGVRAADQEVRRILDGLRETGWLDRRSTIAITSDHGEFLGEHGLLDHGRSVERENVDVFAILVGPDFGAGRRDDTLVQAQDLFPTLLRAAGIKPRRLPYAVPLQTPDPARAAITVSEPDSFWSELSGGRAGTRRYVSVETAAARVVWNDVDGIAPPLDEASAEGRRLAALAEHVAGIEIPRVRLTEVPAELEEGLRSLGYIQ